MKSQQTAVHSSCRRGLQWQRRQRGFHNSYEELEAEKDRHRSAAGGRGDDDTINSRGDVSESLDASRTNPTAF